MGKVAGFFAAITLLVGVYFGTQLYIKSHNTPDRVIQTFVNNLESGQVKPAYDRLAAELRTNREDYWRSFLTQFKSGEGSLKIKSQQSMRDTFNVYPEESEPQRFIYTSRQAGKEQQLNIVTYRYQNVWIIGDLSLTASK